MAVGFGASHHVRFPKGASTARNVTGTIAAPLRGCDKGKPGESRGRKATRLRHALTIRDATPVGPPNRAGGVMHSAIGRRKLAIAAICLGTAVSFGCFRGDNLLAPSGSAGFRPPDPHVTAIALAPTSVNGPAGSHVQISANPQGPSGAPVAADAVAWMSSDPNAATVSGTGMVTLLRRGNTTITAIADGVTASASAVVQAAPAASIIVLPDSALIETSETVQLVATAYDGTGAVDSGAAVNWSSSNTGVASVSGGGLVTAIAVGTAVITASSGSVNATTIIRVTSSAVVVATVSVAPSSSSLYPGRTQHLTATLRDASGNAISGIAVSWSTSNPSAVSVSSSGVATANAVGSATITASAGGKTGSATVNVTPPVVASVSVTPSSGTIGVGQTQQLTATPLDASGNPLSASVSWNSSDPGAASVSQSGQVTGNAAGSATITATAGGVSGSANITVQSGPPGGYHEPSGMAVQINTGPITSTAGFSNFSPSTISSTGEWAGNLTLAPGGSGFENLISNESGGWWLAGAIWYRCAIRWHRLVLPAHDGALLSELDECQQPSGQAV